MVWNQAILPGPEDNAVRICIVGNGQSPLQHREAIDACDLVVRINAWWLTHPNGVAGLKFDAWAWNTALYLVGIREKGEKNKPLTVPPPAGDWAIWALRASSPGKMKRNVKTALKRLGPRPVAYRSEARLKACAKYLSKLRGGRAMPSTGFLAIEQAIGDWLDELVLVGFDATTPSKPGWNDKGNPWRKTWSLHSFVAEKEAMGYLADKGRWLGRKVPFKVTWLGRPE